MMNFAAPCDDNVTASVGAQKLSLSFDLIPKEWLHVLASDEQTTGEPGEGPLHVAGEVSCEVGDIFSGVSLATTECHSAFFRGISDRPIKLRHVLQSSANTSTGFSCWSNTDRAVLQRIRRRERRARTWGGSTEGEFILQNLYHLMMDLILKMMDLILSYTRVT